VEIDEQLIKISDAHPQRASLVCTAAAAAAAAGG